MTVHLKNHPVNTGRHAGVLIPLFSMRDARDWGIGDFRSLRQWIGWSAGLKTKILQILPIHEMPYRQDCPYTALTAFALDPVYICVDEMEDVLESEDIRHRIESPEFQSGFEKARSNAAVNYAAVKDVKFRIQWAAFEHFYVKHWSKKTARAKRLQKYVKDKAAWLADYAIFRAAKDIYGWKSWREWEPGLRDRNPRAIEAFRAANEKQVLFFEYLQWVADEQWKNVKKTARIKGVLLFGDLPFMVNSESSDVWSHRDVFDINSEVGAPPDQFSPEGQKWGLPAYNWAAMYGDNFAWWRSRVKRASEIYDLFRIDHLVGFFRTWIIPSDKNKKPGFDVNGDAAQQKRGEDFLVMVSEAADKTLPVAEDLGLIPDFVRTTLDKLHIPGYKVMRWEKDKQTGQYKDPGSYPVISLATTSTHDCETSKQWWEELDPKEKKLMWQMLGKSGEPDGGYTERVHEVILEKILSAASSIVLLPVQDIFGTGERVNVPGTTGDHNWTYRVAFLPEEIQDIPELKKGGKLYISLLEKTGRALKK